MASNDRNMVKPQKRPEIETLLAPLPPCLGLPWWLSMIKESACNTGDPGSFPGLWRAPGEGNSYPLQYSGLENSMGRGACWATVHGVAKSQTRLSHFHPTLIDAQSFYGEILQFVIDWGTLWNSPFIKTPSLTIWNQESKILKQK